MTQNALFLLSLLIHVMPQEKINNQIIDYRGVGVVCGLGEGEDFGLTRKRGEALEIYHKVWGGGGRAS